MKIFFALLILTSASSSFARSACENRILSHATSIENAAQAALENFSLARQSGDALDTNDARIENAAASLLNAVDGLPKGNASLSAEQKKMLSQICRLRNFNTDTVGEVLEEAAR